MKTLQKVCLALILTAVISSNTSAQDQKGTPGKEKTPGAKVEKDKNDKPDDNKNRGNDNRDRDNKDRGSKKPPGMR